MINRLFSIKNIFINLEVKNKNDALLKIANLAKELQIAKNKNDLYQDFLNREKESSTGFENGIAIPHARSNTILNTSFLFVKFKKAIDWDSFDKELTQYAFVLLVPKENESKDHLEVLSEISTWLLDEEFVNNFKKTNFKNEIYKLIENKLNKKENKQINEEKKASENKINVLALTACPVGVAHTYLAAEKLKESAKKLNINMKVETHGSAGVKNNFSDEEIKNADFIIVASDIGLDLSRFVNKRIYETSVKKAIDNPEGLIENAKLSAKVLSNKNKFDETQTNKNLQTKGEKKSYIMKHILAGISYMIPFIILGGICIALSVGIGKAIYGNDYSAPNGDFLYYLGQIGSVAFSLMIGALGAYIANSIAGRAAIAPAFIVSILGNTPVALYSIGGLEVVTAMGFIGSILFGLLIGYTVKWINSWRVNKSLVAIMPIFVIPLGVGLFYSMLTIFVIGAPIGYLMDRFISTLKQAFSSQAGGLNIGLGIGFGILIGLMAGFDMGGPINKVAFLTCTALISAKIYEPMGMMAAAIPVAPLGMGCCSLVFKKKFNEQEKTMGISAIVMGLIGISEGAIPFAIADPKKAIGCNMLGSAVAGAIAGAAGVTDVAAHGGPIVGVLGAIGSNYSYGIGGGIGFFFLAIIVGTIVTMVVYGLIRSKPKIDTELKTNLDVKKQKKDFLSLIYKHKKNQKVNVCQK